MAYIVYENVFTVPPGRTCRRHWVHPTVLVGGNINDREDLLGLMVDHNVTSVVNVDGRSEAHLHMSMSSFCEVPVADDGNPFSRSAVRHVLSFARMQAGRGALYVHCHIVVSRSPAFAYGILRWALDMSPEEAMAGINSSGGEYGQDYLGYHPKHQTYIRAVEDAISG